MTRNWKDDAREYGRIVRKGGWWVAYLAARNVVEGTGNGRPPKETVSIETVSVTCSARAWAEESKTSASRVLRHLEAWDRAADAGIVPPRSTFVGTDHNVPMPDDEDEPFTGWYDASASVAPQIKGNRRDDIIAAAKADGVGASKTLDVAQNPKAVIAAIKSDPALAKAVAEDTGARLAVSREVNKVADEAGHRSPEAIERDRERKRLAENGTGLIEVLELHSLANDLRGLAEKFVTAEHGGSYTENAIVQIDASVARIIASAEHIRAVAHGDTDTRIPDDLSGLVME